MTAKESGLFGVDEALFRETLARSRILFFRVEWSAMHAAADHWHYYGDIGARNPRIHHSNRWPGAVVRSQVGNLKWIQRLDQEPARW